MKTTILFAALCGALLAGCAVNRSVQLNTQFDPAPAQAMLQPGPNQIAGSALVRQQGGGVVTCAGGAVYLMPITPYAREWASLIYGATTDGYHPTDGPGVQFTNLDQRFASMVKTSSCNAQGFFNFSDVADGSFYAFTKINWRVGGEIQGGSIMKTVTVRGGQKIEVVLAPN